MIPGRVRFILYIAMVPLLLWGATLLYYSRQKPYREPFVPSIVAVEGAGRLHWVPVRWMADTISDRASMFLPVYVDTIRKPFWMQFDLGTPITDFVDIARNFPYLRANERRLTRQVRFQSAPVFFSGFDIRIGDSIRYCASEVPLYDQIDPDSLVETDSMYDTKIGNLGYDAIAGRVLLIDYRRSRIAIVDSLPAEYAAGVEYFDGALVDQFPIYLPIRIDGRERLMQFDNGASAFTLWTSGRQWEAWRDRRRQVDSFPGYSWGQPEFYLRGYPGVRIDMLGSDRSSFPIWTISRERTPSSFLLSIKEFTDGHFGRVCYGAIGNEYFRNELLVFDTRHNRFGRVGEK